MQSTDIIEIVSEEWLCEVVLLLFDYITNGRSIKKYDDFTCMLKHVAFPVSKLEGKRSAIAGILEDGCTEPSGTHPNMLLVYNSQ